MVIRRGLARRQQNHVQKQDEVFHGGKIWGHAASLWLFRLVLALVKVGDGRVDLLLQLVLVPGLQFLDGFVDLVDNVFFVSTLVSLVGLGDAFFGGLQQRHGVIGFLRGLEFVEGFALLGQIGAKRCGGDAQHEHDEGSLEQEAEALFHGRG
jgi:hypothetical protein